MKPLGDRTLQAQVCKIMDLNFRLNLHIIIWPTAISFLGEAFIVHTIHSSLTAVLCLANGYVEKQPVACKENCFEYCLKNHG